MTRKKNRSKVFFLIFFELLLFFSFCFAEEYRIGPQDILRLNFLQQSELNTDVEVSADGVITLPLGGKIKASGLTPDELSQKIVEQVSFYNKNISQVTVRVIEFKSKKVFISGEVFRPGEYAFEKIPNLWEVIMKAGGLKDSANSSAITIIRGGQEEEKKIKVNLKKYLDKGTISDLPTLLPGDIIEIPRWGGLGGGNTYYVYGEVRRPGVYSLGEETDILQALVLAGGTTEQADLKNVKVISKSLGPADVITVDLQKYLKKGTPTSLILQTDDTVVIPSKRGNFWTKSWSVFKDIVPLAGAIASLYLLVDTVRERNRSR
jgi:polysaccharide export outer membrane protein